MRHPWAAKVMAYMWIKFNRQVLSFLERKNLTVDWLWQQEQEAVGTSRPRSTRGIPSPGAVTYGLPNGVEVLAKHWHNKRMAVMFEELASGKVKFSVWKVNKSARQEYLFASQRLQKILRDEPPQADPPAPEDVSLISEQEMLDWSPEQRKEH